MKTKLAIFAGVLLFLFAAYLTTCKVLDPRVQVTRTGVQHSMAAAADYLVAHNLDNGRFIYEVDGEGASTGPRYNVLRHSGAVYSLSMYHGLEPSPELRDTILRAGAYLRDHHVFPVQDLPDTSTVFSLPREEAGRERVAKLGGAGLGLVALVRARALDESLISIDELRQIANFILFMQAEDGSFRSKYSERIKFDDDFNSLYYPGEAILALVELYRVDRDPRWLDAALRATQSLIARQRSYDKLPNDHWLMIAISQLSTVIGDAVDPPVDLDTMLDHAVALGDAMIWEQRWTSLIPGMYGAFTPDARTTPSSTRLEGLAALYQALPASHPARDRLRTSINRGIGFILACQDDDGANRGAFRRALRRRFVGESWRHVRIDYVQHALSAVVGYVRISRSDRQ
jgi:hypothetical protein